MKKLIGPFLAAGLATTPAAATEADSDELLFSDTKGYIAIIESFWGELDKYKGMYEGNDMAVFGLKVRGSYEKIKWDMIACQTLLEDGGKSGKERLHGRFNDEQGLRYDYWLSRPGVKKIDIESVRKSIDKAVDMAVDACSPKIM